jgi:hypothetical protein
MEVVMSDAAPEDWTDDDRRAMPRYFSKGKVRVLRETDAMRSGLAGRMHDVSVSGVGFCIPAELEIGENVRVELSNELQRFKKEVRGIVRHVTPQPDGEFYIGMELRSRLTPPEVELMRSHRPADPGEDKPQWV